jgi:uncharacterized protein
MEDLIQLSYFNELKGGKSNITSGDNHKIYEDKGYFLNSIILQPTTYCNLNCSYCYLPDRNIQRSMPVEIAERVSDFISDNPHKYDILFHSGEPLSVNIDYFKSLMQPFIQNPDISFGVQTNATTLNDKWCELLKEHNFTVGVSIDGYEALNQERKYRNGKPAFPKIIQGINYLEKHDIPYSVISVVQEDSFDKAKDIYDFFKKFKTKELGINFEEKEGINNSGFFSYKKAKKFWSDLYDVSANDTSPIPIREFRQKLNRMSLISSDIFRNVDYSLMNTRIDLLPTIEVNGNVTLFSPELASLESQYACGNLNEHSLEEVINFGIESQFTEDFTSVVNNCRDNCEYYQLCGGGFASNRISEHGNLKNMETNFCKVNDKALTDVILEKL